ncbi:unnamed protein product [Ectocarpus sp. 12 AP-2014]
MRVTGKQLEAEPGSGAIAKASEKLDRIAASKGRSANGTILSRLLLSRLEEAQELQEVVRTSSNKCKPKRSGQQKHNRRRSKRCRPQFPRQPTIKEGRGLKTN